MDLRAWAASRAARRASVLLVEAPGAWACRAAVERAVLDAGWSVATSPAAADVLAVCGAVPEAYADPLAAIWDQLPGPRTRVDVAEPEAARAALDQARRRLLDADAQSRDARERVQDVREDGHGDMDHEGMDHEGMDHGGMDHGGMDMSPDGIPLAEGAPDRDGLEMDVLHLRLGPGLAHWPAGLVVTCTLQGDVVVEADGEWLAGADSVTAAADPLLQAARRADALSSVLGLAGWDDGLDRARRVRDLLLDAHADGGTAAGEAARRGCADLTRRVRRSRLLRWSLRHVHPRAANGLDERDAYDLLLAGLGHLDALVGDRAGHPPPRRPEADVVAGAVAGLDVATARLVVACLDLAPEPAAEAARG